MVDDNLPALHDAGKDFPAKRQPVGNIQVTAGDILNVSDDLPGLVINGSEGGFLPKQEAVDSSRNNSEPVFEDMNQRQENPIRYPKARNKKQDGIGFVSESIESHFFKVINRPVRFL